MTKCGDKLPKTVGVLGGMGPEATVDFLHKLLQNTPASTDQEHLHVIADINPKVPNRQEAILRSADNPLPTLCHMAQGLEKAGADFIVMPCNTAHYYLGEIRESVIVHVVDMPRLVTDYALQRYPELRTFGLLAASGAIKAKLYQKWFQASGVDLIIPKERAQSILMDQIGLIKAGNKGEQVRRRILKVAEALVKAGAEAIILGCTELPLVRYRNKIQTPIIDGNRVLAECIVKIALGEYPLED